MSNQKFNIFSNDNRLAAILLAFLFSTAIISDEPALANDTEPTQVSIEASVSLEWDQTKGVYIAIGDAIVVQGDKSLEANEIVAQYDAQSEDRDLTHITATGSVVYNDGDNVALGSKMDYTIKPEAYDLFGPKASIKGQNGTMMAEESITFKTGDSGENQVVGIGKASYAGKDGRTIEGDKVVALLGSNREIKAINADGNAKVVTPKGIVATADRLDYAAATDRADLFGNVEIIDLNNVMRGARAEVEFNKEISRLLSDNSGKRVTGMLTP